jgi:hypothetical protein
MEGEWKYLRKELCSDRSVRRKHTKLKCNFFFRTRCYNIICVHVIQGARGSVVDLRHYATSWKVAGSSPVVDSTSNRNEYQDVSWGKKRPGRRADNLAAECLKMWEPQPLAILRAPTTCIGITLFLPLLIIHNYSPCFV